MFSIAEWATTSGFECFHAAGELTKTSRSYSMEKDLPLVVLFAKNDRSRTWI